MKYYLDNVPNFVKLVTGAYKQTFLLTYKTNHISCDLSNRGKHGFDLTGGCSVRQGRRQIKADEQECTDVHDCENVR